MSVIMIMIILKTDLPFMVVLEWTLPLANTAADGP